MRKIDPPERRIVLLTSIGDHQIFKEHQELLVDEVYLLKVAKHLKPEAVYQLLEMHPIVAVEIKKHIICIAGIRSLNIASQILPLDSLIPVCLLKKLDEEQIANYCYADLLLTPLVLSLDSGGHVFVDTLLAKIGGRCDAWTDLANCSKVTLATAFGLSRGSLYAHERKKRQSD